MALAKVQQGMPIRQAAAESGIWPQAVYQAIKREGIKLHKATSKKGGKR